MNLWTSGPSCSKVKFNPGFSFLCSKAFSRIIFSVIFRASNHQLVELKLKCFLAFKSGPSCSKLGYDNPGLVRDLKASKAFHFKFFLCTSWWLEALKITAKIIRANALEYQKKKLGLSANRPPNNWARNANLALTLGCLNPFLNNSVQLKSAKIVCSMPANILTPSTPVVNNGNVP